MSEDRIAAVEATMNIVVWFVAVFGIIATFALIVAVMR